jgi:hypothetical protein
MRYEEVGRFYTDRLTRAAQHGSDTHDEALRWLGRNDLFFLLTVILGRRDANHPWIFDRCREVQRSPDGHLDLWSREHFKSSIITFALTIQDILRDPEITVGIFSHTRGIAKGFLTVIMREFKNNDLLKGLYPDVLWADPTKQAPKWSEDEGIIVRRKSNPKESTVEAWGLVDGQPTSKHYRLRVYDDVVTLESVGTPAQIHKVTQAWEMSDNLGARGGSVRYIGTRYHMADTYAVMMERGVVQPRIYPATDNGRLDGKPVLLTQKEWDDKKRVQRSTIAAQMLQNPLSGEDQTFEAGWLKGWEIRPRIMNVAIMVDPSKGRTASSDRTAIVVIGTAINNKKFLLDGYCHRMKLSERWQRVRDLHKKWKAAPGCNVVGVGYERYGAQSDDEYFRERMVTEKYPFPLTELSWPREGRGDKETRIARLEPDLRMGNFLLPLPVYRSGIGPATWSSDTGAVVYAALAGISRVQQEAINRGDAPLLAKAIRRTDEDGKIYDVTIRLIEELVDHPYGQHDDIADAASRIYDMEVAPPPSPAGMVEEKSYWDG